MDNGKEIVMQSNVDFREVILDQQKDKKCEVWCGTVLDYLYKIKEDPSTCAFAPGRMYNVLQELGTEPVPEKDKMRGYEDLVRYKFFDNKIFGSLEPIHDIANFLKAAAKRTETGKRILILVGPVGSGKSSITALLKRGLEASKIPKYTIEGCPIHEEPLHMIPYADRPYWEGELGVKIEGFPCPVCQQRLDTEFTKDGVTHWDRMPVTSFTFSEQRRAGIGTFSPSDPKNQDVSELIGRINMAKLNLYGETDPRGFQFDGELQVANGGMIEMIELLKVDIKIQYVLISLAQEQLIKSPGFPQMYIDTLVLAHTNQTEYDSFASDKKNEALHDRMYPIMVPWNLKVDNEIKIYEKMIKESDFRNVHIAPHTLKLAAQFAVLSRLTPSKKVSSLVEKMRLYNGEETEAFKKEEVDVKSIREEGRAQGEGMKGISPRFIINAINIALGSKESKNNCINPIDIIRALRSNFNHQIGVDEKDIERYTNLLIGEKESVNSEFKEVAKKEVNMAFLYAYEEQAQSLFERYMENVKASVKKDRVLDELTGEYKNPDEKLMRSIEELIEIPQNSANEFRNGIFVHYLDAIERKGSFGFKDYDILRSAIEKKLMSDLKSVVDLSLADTTSTDPKKKMRREKAHQTLMERGYCEHCANVLLRFVGEILRRE